MKLLLVGGGSGGHIVPILPVLKEFGLAPGQASSVSAEPVSPIWVGSKDGPEHDLAPRLGIKYYAISTGKLRRYFSWQNFVDLFRIPVGIVQSFHILGKEKPDVIFSKGGYVSIPVVVAGALKRIPIVIHESDVRPGLATKLGAKVAKIVCVAFEETKQYLSHSSMVVTGNPVRAEIAEGDAEVGRQLLELKRGLKSETLPVVLIMGGSQGSSAINQAVWNALPELSKFCCVVHQCGQGKVTPPSSIELPEIQARYRAYEYFDQDLKHMYALSDLVVTRAGSNQLSELALLGKPAIVIPLPGSAGDHQLENAKLFQEHGASILLPQDQLSAEQLIKHIKNLLEHHEEREKLSTNIRKLHTQGAARKVAEQIMKAVRVN